MCGISWHLHKHESKVRSSEVMKCYYFYDILQLSSETDIRSITRGFKTCLLLYWASTFLVPIYANTGTPASKQMPLLTVRKEALLVKAKTSAVIKSNNKAHYALPTAFILSETCLHCSSQLFQNLLGLIL